LDRHLMAATSQSNSAGSQPSSATKKKSRG
jgi:hypothetical protein